METTGNGTNAVARVASGEYLQSQLRHFFGHLHRRDIGLVGSGREHRVDKLARQFDIWIVHISVQASVRVTRIVFATKRSRGVNTDAESYLTLTLSVLIKLNNPALKRLNFIAFIPSGLRIGNVAGNRVLSGAAVRLRHLY